MSANTPLISSTKDVTLPPKEELLKAMQNAEKSPELAHYLRTRVNETIQNSKIYNKTPAVMKTAQEVKRAVEEFVQFVEYKFSQRAQIWSGEVPETSSFKNMQQGIAEKAVSDLTEKNYAAIRFDFAVSQDGHFVRGYADQGAGDPLEKRTIESLDQLFNAWLAKAHQIVTEDGYLFKTDPDGKKGQRLTMEEVDALMIDNAKEFKAYVKESNVPTELVSNQREYPGERRLEEIRRDAAEKAVEKVIEAKEAEDAAKQVDVPSELPGIGHS